MELPYARAREGVTGNQHLARLSRCKRAHIRLLSAPRSERATTAIQDYLGHRSIASTVRYTALAPDRFKGFWRD